MKTVPRERSGNAGQWIHVPKVKITDELGNQHAVESFVIARECLSAAGFLHFVQSTGYTPTAGEGFISNEMNWHMSDDERLRSPAFLISPKDAFAYAEWASPARLPSESEWLAASCLDLTEYDLIHNPRSCPWIHANGKPNRELLDRYGAICPSYFAEVTSNKEYEKAILRAGPMGFLTTEWKDEDVYFSNRGSVSVNSADLFHCFRLAADEYVESLDRFTRG